jgi:hypothetical protein
VAYAQYPTPDGHEENKYFDCPRAILFAQEGDRRIPKTVGRHFNWIWFLGAAVWFFDAALGMHHGALGVGLADAGISALFLAIGIFFRRQAKRHPGSSGPR